MTSMTDNSACPYETYDQRFAVSFDYPVVFTRAVFDPANPVLATVIDRRGEARRHRVLVCVDSGVVEATHGMLAHIEAYFAAHAGTIELVAPPTVVPGGEQAKSSWDHVLESIAAAGRRHLCRQSVVAAIGGGSVLDMVGFAAALVHRGLRLA